MTDSILFSQNDTEEINNFISSNIDARLYLFAYYSPKQIPNKNSVMQFWTGVLNLYALFFDCSPFLFRSQCVNFVNSSKKYENLLNNFVSEGLLQISEETYIRSLISLINSLRTLFCHNATLEDYGNRTKIKDVINFFSKFTNSFNGNISNIGELCLSDSEWNDALLGLYNITKQCKIYIKNCLSTLSTHPQKQRIIDNWLYLFIGWYQTNDPFMKSAISDYYELKMTAKKQLPPYKNMYTCINKIKNNYKAKWVNEIEKTVFNMKSQALPYCVLIDIINNEVGQISVF